MKPVIAITCGDTNGIGPEIALKCAADRTVRRHCLPMLVGPAAAFDRYRKHLGKDARLVPYAATHNGGWTLRLPDPSHDIPLFVSSSLSRSSITPGATARVAGEAAVRAIERAVMLVHLGIARALVTGPVSKHAIHLAGLRYPGQTEMLQALTSSRHVAMMLVTRGLRVGLVTIHLPIARVAATISRDLLRKRILVIRDALIGDWKIRRPKLAVLGLNPHAGENGELGPEEGSIIGPVLQSLRRTGYRLDGPFPADAFFARYRPGSYDAVVAMYHDQGLIPLKMASRGRGVNVSVGLPIVRTSPDHGTAFDIAGRGKADPSSMIEAVRLAVTLSANRAHTQRRQA